MCVCVKSKYFLLEGISRMLYKNIHEIVNKPLTIEELEVATSQEAHWRSSIATVVEPKDKTKLLSDSYKYKLIDYK